MAILPNAERAAIDIGKLENYYLNADHPTGSHKARLWASMLGIGKEDAEWLRAKLLEAVLSAEAIPKLRNEYGQRYEVRFEMEGKNGKMKVVRLAWIVDAGADHPRLTTCFPETDGEG